MTLIVVAVFVVAHPQQFFPTATGQVGHDYAYFMPYLLAGRYWAAVNGYFSVPDFIPAFCGGMPWLANPQSLYFSLPQWLSFAFEPVLTVWLTYLIAAGFGATGIYVLCRSGLRTSTVAAALSAALFALNGYLAARLFVGHLPFHAFAVLPWIGYALVGPATINGTRRAIYTIVVRAAWSAIGLAYLVYAGLPHFGVQAGLIGIAVICLRELRFGRSATPWMVLAGTVILVVPLVLPKLLPALRLMQQFPDGGSPTLGLVPVSNEGALVLLSSLFLPALVPDFQTLVGHTGNIGKHEFNYSITLVPVIVFFAAMFARGHLRMHNPGRSWPSLLLLVSTLTLPIMVSFGDQSWSATLQQLPYIGTAAVNARWWAILIIPLILMTALAFDAISQLGRARSAAAAGLMGLAMVQVGHGDEAYYAASANYSPATMQVADLRLRASHAPTPITLVGPSPLRTGPDGTRIGPNDGIAFGYVSFLCYEPLFGYQLQNFPAPLPPGVISIDRTKDETLPLSDPACYFGEAIAGCAPGTRFPTSAREEFGLFIDYRPLPHEILSSDRTVRRFSVACWVMVAVTAMLGGVAALWRLPPLRPGPARTSADNDRVSRGRPG